MDPHGIRDRKIPKKSEKTGASRKWWLASLLPGEVIAVRKVAPNTEHGAPCAASATIPGPSQAFRTRPRIAALRTMTTPSSLEILSERVEQLALRYEQLLATHEQLCAEMRTVVQERNSLLSRLKAARARVDALVQQLPANQEST